MATESTHCLLYRVTVQFATIFCLLVVGSAHSLQNENNSDLNTVNISIPIGFQNDTARNPKLYPLKSLNKVLTRLFDLHKGSLVTTPSTTTPSAVKSKIECKFPTDLIIVYDDTANVDDKEFPKVLDFVATVSAAWRMNLKCHVSLIPQSAVISVDIPFSKTIEMDEYQIKAGIYGSKRVDKRQSNLVDAFKMVHKEIKEHLLNHGLPINVLLLTATYKTGNIQDAAAIITELTNKMHINTMVIGISERRMISENLLLKFANYMDRNFKLVSSFSDLKYCYQFLQEHLVPKPTH